MTKAKRRQLSCTHQHFWIDIAVQRLKDGEIKIHTLNKHDKKLHMSVKKEANRHTFLNIKIKWQKTKEYVSQIVDMSVRLSFLNDLSTWIMRPSNTTVVAIVLVHGWCSTCRVPTIFKQLRPSPPLPVACVCSSVALWRHLRWAGMVDISGPYRISGFKRL